MSHQDPSVPPNAAGDTPESLVAEARRLTDERRFERAIGRLSEALESHPERLDWLSFRANLLQIAARHEEALADLEKVLDRTPTDEAAWRNLAHSRLVLGRVDQAEQALLRAVELNPGSVDDMADLGTLYRQAGRHDEAIRWLGKAVSAQPGDAELHTLLGAALLAGGQSARGRASLERSFGMNPYDRTTLAHLYVALCHTGDLQTALDLTRPDLLVQSFQREGALPGSADGDDLDRRLAEHVHSHPTLVFERPGNTTRGGAQTGNLLEESPGPVAELMAWIGDRVRSYFASLPADATHPYLAWKPERWDIEAWGVVIRAGGYQRAHLHADGWISGVYYVTVPGCIQQESDDESGCLEIGRPTEAFCQQGEFPTRVLRPRPGRMHLFPSFLWHRTLPYESDEERICIAFDVRPQV